MTRRSAAIVAFVAFALAWIVGVFCGHSPTTRLQSALIALLFGGCAGAAIGVAMQRIVLWRIAENWDALHTAQAKASGADDAATPEATNPGTRAATVESPAGEMR